MTDKTPAEIFFLHIHSRFPKEGRANIVTLEYLVRCYHYIKASLGLLLCILLVVEEIRPETHPRCVVLRIVYGEWLRKECGSIRNKNRLRKANNLKYRRRYWPNMTTSQSTQSQSQYHSTVFKIFSLCRNATERHIQGVLVLCSVRILFNTCLLYTSPSPRD